MHMNHRPIVPVRNAAEIAYKNVVAISLHANPSILSRFVARDTFRDRGNLKWWDAIWLIRIFSPEKMEKRISLLSARASRTKSMLNAYNCWCADARSHDSLLLRAHDWYICSTHSWFPRIFLFCSGHNFATIKLFESMSHMSGQRYLRLIYSGVSFPLSNIGSTVRRIRQTTVYLRTKQKDFVAPSLPIRENETY